jgi:hypothetical protein
MGMGFRIAEIHQPGRLFGGLIGAGIASGIENANAKRQKVKYYIDPDTGGQGKTILENEVR